MRLAASIECHAQKTCSSSSRPRPGWDMGKPQPRRFAEFLRKYRDGRSVRVDRKYRTHSSAETPRILAETRPRADSQRAERGRPIHKPGRVSPCPETV